MSQETDIKEKISYLKKVLDGGSNC